MRIADFNRRTWCPSIAFTNSLICINLVNDCMDAIWAVHNPCSFFLLTFPAEYSYPEGGHVPGTVDVSTQELAHAKFYIPPPLRVQ